MTVLERRETRLLCARRAAQLKQPIHPHHVAPYSDTDPLPYTDPAMHHHMSDSRKHHQDVFSLARLFPDDPATKVRFTFDVNFSTDLINQFRTLSLGWKITSLVASVTSPTMVIKTPFLIKIACQFTLWTIKFIHHRCLESITLRTTFAEIKTLWTLVPTLTSWFYHAKTIPRLTPIGTPEYLEYFISEYFILIHPRRTARCSTWRSCGFDGSDWFPDIGLGPRWLDFRKSDSYQTRIRSHLASWICHW